MNIEDSSSNTKAFNPWGALPYRGWSFCVHSYNWELLEKYVDQALTRAEMYGINTFELHDYFIGNRGIVDACVTYKNFPRLAEKTSFQHNGELCSLEKRRADYVRFRKLAGRIKDKGIKLNVWYHILRDAPVELMEEYPETGILDSGFIWVYLDGLFSEFFERVPEVDRIVITSLNETPSILYFNSLLTREDRLVKLYETIHDVCKKNGKELVIRDFAVKRVDFESFETVLSRLPADIYVMSKEILADWTHLWLSANPFLKRYAEKHRLIVEFDLYGEFWGRLDVPACFPEYIHYQMRQIRSNGAYGAVGRIIHDSEHSETFNTIFDSPNDINCFAFGRYLNKSMYSIENENVWKVDTDTFDKRIWFEWAAARYGKSAAIHVIHILSDTTKIIDLLFNLGGRFFQAHSYLPGRDVANMLWLVFLERMQNLGIRFLRDEKKQAYELAEKTLKYIRMVKGSFTSKEYGGLTKLFKGVLLIIDSYRFLLESYYKIYMMQKNRNIHAGTVPGKLKKLAVKIERSYGTEFFGGLPETLRGLAAFAEEGKEPDEPYEI